MKKVLVKIVRQTRKEYMKKEKRIAQEEKRHAKKQKKENGAAADATSASRHPAVPEWLTSHGSVYVVADDVLYARNHEAAADAWTRVADAANVVAIVSFGSDLVAALADQTVCALNQENGAGTWNKICDGPGKPIKSLAGLRGSLLCCTEEGKVMKQEGAGRFASGKWQQIGEVDGAEALEKLEFEACAIEVEAIGATSHDATLIVLTKDSLAYVSNDNAIVKTVPLGLPQAAQKLTAFASHKGLCCPMDSIHRSPVTEGYRNKCEFSIGYDENGKPCIGFRLGLYRDGSIVVSRPDQCVNVSTVMKNVCDAVQALIEKSGAPVYDLKAHAGFWRLLTVRHSERTNDLMIMLVVKPDDIKVAQYEALKKQIIEHLTDSALPFKVSSLYVQEYSGVSTASEKDPTILIHGKPTIEEILLDMRFSVSPHAFFQVNTEGAEALYSLVRSHAKANESTLLYDVCCGTGTIGICASKGVGKVVGIEICKSATDNAAENAKLNNVKNVSFINSKAEDVMKDLLKAKLSDDEAHLQNVVAIVDPPRAGLHNQVLRSLRGCPPVKRIVYVSCNPTGSLIQDATMLCGPKTKSINGEPFHPAYGVPVDMFPHTPHCEMIVVFERD
ncbi:TPA: hypothetical protein N0F65_003882 [Lagenidium giganteum]|uniref:Uncharacterized protein n=1 Tax=Lagenidium giganteum TaxID=4803 RepID=A0AAV2ZCU2_9STRA|nr:TPA: hypothetical protein N0F65_003882 [Lagenidium giganteum]